MRVLLWILAGLALWLWVHDVALFVPGPFWFPATGVLVMGILTGVLGHVWERAYEDAFDPDRLRTFVARPLCIVAWVGGGLFGANNTFGNASAGYKSLNALFDGTTGAIAAWVMVWLMLRWRYRPGLTLGVVAGIGVVGIVAPIGIMDVVEGLK